MSAACCWHGRWGVAGRAACEVACAVGLCVVIQLFIWAVRLALGPASLEFLAPICGMVLVLVATAALSLVWTRTELIYQTYIRSTIDLLNRNLGVCFTIPLIQVSKGPLLPGAVIGKIIATVLITNAISWPVMFLLATVWQVGLSPPRHRAWAKSQAWEAVRSALLMGRAAAPVIEGRPDPSSTSSCVDLDRQQVAVAAAAVAAAEAPPLSTESKPHQPACRSAALVRLSRTGDTTNTTTTATNTTTANITTTTITTTTAVVTGLARQSVPSIGAAPSSEKTASMVLPLPATAAAPASTAATHAAATAATAAAAATSLEARRFFGCRLRGLTANAVLDLVVDRIHLVFTALLIVLLGIPLAVAAGEDRPLDFGFLFFFWLSTTELQQMLRPAGRWYRTRPRLASAANVFATLVNPVLFTTILMVGYTEVRARAGSSGGLHTILATFGGGSSLSTLLSYHAGLGALPPGRPDWFGAGDAALAMLECGIVAWGFKLYECRRQLCSRAGLAAMLTSACAAVFSVFVSVLIARRGVGLGQAEALAFSARSTTLALSRPAMETLGGNTVVNAAVVVFNGILGQWLYPLVPRLLGVPETRAEEAAGDEAARAGAGEEGAATTGDGAGSSISSGGGGSSSDSGDEPIMAAAGVTVGVNGAAMGVAYLYSHRAQAAPFATLTMTIFGVMTVIFTCLGPFPSILRALTA